MFNNPGLTSIWILAFGIFVYFIILLMNMIIDILKKKDTERVKRGIGSFIVRNRVSLSHFIYFAYVIIIAIFGTFKIFTAIIGLLITSVGGLFRAWAIRYKIEKTILIKAGPYRFARHPRYFGNFMIGLGIAALSDNIPIISSYFVLFFIVYYNKIVDEEINLIRNYGKEYLAYKKKVGTFIPFIKILRKEEGSGVKSKERGFLKPAFTYLSSMLMNLFITFLLYLKTCLPFSTF
jgi:protein-S-isoprenylcysteine O-methyltransferase Ste14